MSRPHPPPSADERTTLEAFLDHERATLLMKAEGLARRQLNQRLPTSELTLPGLPKHLALAGADWIQVRFPVHRSRPRRSAVEPAWVRDHLLEETARHDRPTSRSSRRIRRT